MFKYIVLGFALFAGSDALNVRHEADGTWLIIQLSTQAAYLRFRLQQATSSKPISPTSREPLWSTVSKTAKHSGSNILITLPPSQWHKQPQISSMRPTRNSNWFKPPNLSQAPPRQEGWLLFPKPMASKTLTRHSKISAGTDSLFPLFRSISMNIYLRLNKKTINPSPITWLRISRSSWIWLNVWLW